MAARVRLLKVLVARTKTRHHEGFRKKGLPVEFTVAAGYPIGEMARDSGATSQQPPPNNDQTFESG
jgi:hypothetical protein